MKRFPAPFRLRIALLSASVSGVVLLAFGLAAWIWLNHDRLDSLDREIRALAYRHPGWLNNRSNYENVARAIEFIVGGEQRFEIAILATDLSGNIRFRSTHWPPGITPSNLDLQLAPAPPDTVPSLSPSGAFTRTPRFLTAQTPGGTWRLGILGNDRDRLIVGLDCRRVQAELARLRNGFLLALPAALALIGAGGWIVAGQAVRPLRHIARAAEQTTARGLDQRIPASTEDPEIDRLVTVLNRMMDRLQASFRQATRFSADASHELKTPLAVMQGELEAALQQAPDGSREQDIYASLLDETQRLKTILRSLLLLARADSGHLPLTRTTWSLSDELTTLASDARILAEDAGLTLSSRLPDGILVSADRVLLRLALSNLLDNAIHYNRPGGVVDLSLETPHAQDRAVVRVANTGSGIPPADQPLVFDRFHRGTEARSRRRDGAGLGLSLAREIASAHQGELTLVESNATRTLFQLSIPITRS